MRILIHGINFHPEPVGVGKYTGEMAYWLAARGHEVRVVTAPPFTPQWSVSPEYSWWKYKKERADCNGSIEQEGNFLPLGRAIEVLRCPVWVPASPRGLRRLLHLASFAVSSWPIMLYQILWRPEIVVLVAPTVLCAPQALVVARWSGGKAWLHIQDFEVDAAFDLGDFSHPRMRNFAIALEQKLLQKFDKISTISQRMMERLSVKGADMSRCLLFPNWVNLSSIYPLQFPSSLRQELGISNNSTVVLYSGSMGQKQGLEILVDVASALEDYKDIWFVFCGEGPSREALEQGTNHLPQVRFLPIQPPERLNDLLNLADIHVLPQRADAADLVMPSKLIGMFASGRPVVATAHPDTQLATTVFGRGILVPPGDSASFGAAIVQLSTKPAMRMRLGENARSYAVAQFDVNKILTSFEEAVAHVCNKPVASKTRNDGLELDSTCAEISPEPRRLSTR